MKLLTIDRVSGLEGGRIALHAVPPAREDLEFVYRAGLSIYWNPELSRLEDRCATATTPSESFDRIQVALRSELGVRLVVTDSITWEGLPDADRRAIESRWER